MGAQRIHFAGSLLIAAGLVTFLSLSATGRILRNRETPSAVFVGAAQPLLIEWEQGTPTCAYCGGEVQEENRSCSHCARGLVWATGRCEACAGAGGEVCPECKGKRVGAGCMTGDTPLCLNCGGDGRLRCRTCGGDGVLGN